MAFARQGKAGWDLVKTYQDERRPVSQTIVMQSFINAANVMRINEAAVDAGETWLSAQQVVQESRRYGNHLGGRIWQLVLVVGGRARWQNAGTGGRFLFGLYSGGDTGKRKPTIMTIPILQLSDSEKCCPDVKTSLTVYST